MGISSFITDFITRGDYSVSDDIISALKKEEYGKITPVLTPNNTIEEAVAKYLEYRYSIYQAKYSQINAEYHVDNPTLDLAIALTALEALIFGGKYHLARELSAKIEKNPNLQNSLSMDQMSWILKGILAHDLGRFSEAENAFEEAIHRVSDKSYAAAEAFIGLGDVRVHQGRYDEASKLLKMAENLLKDGNQFYYRHYLHAQGINQFYQAKHEEALEYFENALNVSETYRGDHMRSRIYFSISETYLSLGDLRLSKQYIDQAVPILRRIGNNRDYSFCFMIENMILTLQNKQEQALSKIDKAIELLEEIGHQQDLASCYQMKGETLAAIGNLNEAMQYFERSLEIKREVGNPTLLGLSLFQIIIQRINQELEITEYYQELEKLVEIHPGYVKNFLSAVDAYRLKQKNRLRDKVNAMNIFESLKDNQDLEYDLFVFTMKNFCELLLDELRLFESPATLESLHDNINKVLELARHNRHYKLEIEMTIISSRLLLIQGKLDESHQLLVQLTDYIDTLNNAYLTKLIEMEHQRFDQEIDTWKMAIQQGQSVNELIQVSKIKDYLTEVANRLDFER